MDSPQTIRKQLPFYGRHNAEFFANSSTTSLHSSSNNSSNLLLSNRSSVYTPNIERQLHSLVIEDDDTKEDTAELLQQTFDQLDVEAQENSIYASHQQQRPNSFLTTDKSFQSSVTDEDYKSTSCKSNPSLFNGDNDSVS